MSRPAGPSRGPSRLFRHPAFEPIGHPVQWLTHPARWKLRKRLRNPLFAAARIHRRTLSRNRRVILVVGSLGKTTATRAARAAIGLPVDSWSEGNFNHGVFLPLMLMRHSPFRHNLVLEAGIGQPGMMRDFARTISPTVTVVTSIGTDHIVRFPGGIEQIRDEKAWAVRLLPPTGTAVLNGDDPNVEWMAGETAARIVRYGSSPRFDVWADEMALEWPRGMAFTLHAGEAATRVRSRLLGQHMVPALLAGATAAVVAGLDLATIARRLGALPPTRMRCQLVSMPGGYWFLRDDYKSTPDSVYSALQALAGLPGRRIVVLGGLDAAPKPVREQYRLVGAAAARAADVVVLIDHREQRQAYRSGLRQGGFDFTNLHQGATVEDAVAHLRRLVLPGDVILLKGHNEQKFARIVLAMQGRDVRCRRVECRLEFQPCDTCVLLSR